MSVKELIAELSNLSPELDVLVAESPSHDQCPLAFIVPHEHTDGDYVLLAGAFDDK